MKNAFFLSDLHLGATYNSPGKSLERKVVAFLDSIKNEATEIYLLGDILDYWFEYRHVVPRGYVRFFGKLAELSDSGVKITWLIGNHDIWIFDYLPSELGIEVVDGVIDREILGVPFSMQHGDAIGGSTKFRFLRSLFRNKFCQRLYSGIHPRWTVGFAHSCSRRSRIKENSEGYVPANLIGGLRKWVEEEILIGNPAKYFVFGHLHKAYDEVLNHDRHLIVVPPFTEHGAYGVFDGESFKICNSDI